MVLIRLASATTIAMTVLAVAADAMIVTAANPTIEKVVMMMGEALQAISLAHNLAVSEKI